MLSCRKGGLDKLFVPCLMEKVNKPAFSSGIIRLDDGFALYWSHLSSNRRVLHANGIKFYSINFFKIPYNPDYTPAISWLTVIHVSNNSEALPEFNVLRAS